MASDATSSSAVPGAARTVAREMSAAWWGVLLLGILWTGFGMFVLSYRVVSLAAVAAFVGIAFLFGGFTELALVAWVRSWRLLYVVVGVTSLVAGVVTFAWPSITLYIVSVFLAWFLIVFGVMHVVSALAGPKVSLWWSQLLLGVGELVLGIWAIRSWERSLLALVTLVGIWAVAHGISQIFTAFALREAGKQMGVARS